MSNTQDSYLSELTDQATSSWMRFWFTPNDPFAASVMRIITGLAAIYYLVGFSADLTRWFAFDGILPVEAVRSLLSGPDGDVTIFSFSYLDYLSSPAELWTAHIVGLIILAMFTVGLYSRTTSVLSFIVVLSYVHRAPMLNGLFEPVLVLLVAYLMFAPSGMYLSLDSLLKRKKEESTPPRYDSVSTPKSMAATVSIRLIQVHLAAFYLMFGLSKLMGDAWWEGEAIWTLMAQTETRLFDFSSFRDYPILINAWTHSIVAFELLFPIFIWYRLPRPLLLTVGVFMWGSLALVTGTFGFCFLMIFANLAFIPSETLRSWLSRFLPQADVKHDQNIPAPKREKAAV